MTRTSGSGWQRAGGCAIALCLLGWAAAPAVPAVAAPVDSWQPIDDGIVWSGPTLTPVPADEVVGCAGQRSRWDGEPGSVTLIVLECKDAGTAADAVKQIARDPTFSPIADASPVLGEDFDVVLGTDSGELARYWSQGTTYFGVGTSCRQNDCVAATARYQEELSALVGSQPNRLWSTPVTGPVTSHRPSGGPWVLVNDVVLPSAQLRVTDCAEAVQREWRSVGRVFAMVSIVDCGTPELAFRAWSDLWVSISPRPADGGVLGPGIDAAGNWDHGDGRVGFARAWVQGSQYVYVHRICEAADLVECGKATAVDAGAIAPLVAGALRTDSRGTNLAVLVLLMLLVFPIVTTAVVLIARAVWRRSQDGGWSVVPAPSSFIAVDGRVRRARLLRWARTAVVATVVVGCYAGGVFWATSLGNPIIFGLWMFAAPIVLIPLVSGLIRGVWPSHPLARVARGPRGGATASSVVGVGLRVGASGLAVLALLGYVVCTVLLMLVTYQTPDLTEKNVAALSASGNLFAIAFGSVLGLVAELERRGLVPLLFLAVIAGPMTVAYLLDRLGQRLGQRSLQAVLAADTRPYILYLRGFEEDDLRITPSLTRSSFLQWLTPFGRPRFEEVLVRYLSRFGPVIAVSGQQQRALPEIGAAKAIIADGEWQRQVHAWMGDALAVVVAATPAQVRDGLMWELVQLSDAERRPRILLVTAPWPREQLRARWRGFLETTTGLPLFDSLVQESFPDGVQVMTWTSEDGWRGYGARRRWDWSYAAALVAAVEDAAEAWNRDRVADSGRQIEPDTLPSRSAGAGPDDAS